MDELQRNLKEVIKILLGDSEPVLLRQIAKNINKTVTEFLEHKQ